MKSDFLTDYDISAVPGCDCDDVTAENFDERVLAREKPCVMRGLVADWPVVQAAKVSAQHLADYLISLDAGKSARTFVAPPGIGGRYFYNDDMTGFNFEQRQGPIVDIIRSLIEISDLDSPPGIYAGATSSDELFPAFARHNEMPLLGPGVRPLAWIGNASRVAPHFDTSRNIACVVAGTRRFLLFPPSQIENLYVGPIDHTMAGQPASLVDPRAIDEEKFPRFAKALSAAQMVTLEPGDAIYIPSMWWHYVEAEGSFNMLVNYWWNEGYSVGPMETLALALLVIRELPEPQRAAWHELFDHYVFSRSAQEAADHLPLAARGVLGSPSDQRDMQIKQFLRARLPQLLQ